MLTRSLRIIFFNPINLVSETGTEIERVVGATKTGKFMGLMWTIGGVDLVIVKNRTDHVCQVLCATK